MNSLFGIKQGGIQLLSGSQFKAWFDQLPDEDIDGFEEAVHAASIMLAEGEKDGMARNCLLGFFGDNPSAWAEDAVQTISTNCKGTIEARRIVHTVVNDALIALGYAVPTVL